MAGSWYHVTSKRGRLRQPGNDCLDNLGDAREAIAHMHRMIWSLADGDATRMADAAASTAEARFTYRRDAVGGAEHPTDVPAIDAALTPQEDR